MPQSYRYRREDAILVRFDCREHRKTSERVHERESENRVNVNRYETGQFVPDTELIPSQPTPVDVKMKRKNSGKSRKPQETFVTRDEVINLTCHQIISLSKIFFSE